MGRLDGKIAVITGATSGIGLATAKEFVAEGAYVFITGRRQAVLDAAVKEIGRNVTGVQGDTMNLADLDRLYATVKETKGTLDVVFANVGAGTFMPLGAITEEHYRTTFDTDVKSTLFTVQKALPLLKDGGSIIVNSSILAEKGLESFSMSNAAKAAVRSLARSWASDLKPRRIRVNAISPGVIVTPGYKLLLNDEEIRKFEEEMAAKTPAGRTGRPEEIAKAVVFLASDDSSFVNAANMIVDGGISFV